MVQNWRLLAALLSLPILSLSAEEVATEQEIAVEETAYSSKFGQSTRTLDKKCPTTRKRAAKPARLYPEEELIKSAPTITPSLSPQVADGAGVFLIADFIYWRTFIDAMEYSYTGVSDSGYAVPPLTNPLGQGSVNVKQGSAQYPDFRFQPGVKAGLGWHVDHDGWDMTALWTYLPSRTSTNSTAVGEDSLSGMVAVDPVVFSDGTIQSVNLRNSLSKWKQDFNVIDLELGRDFFFSRYLTMRPHIGFKSAWVFEVTDTTLTPIPVDLITLSTGDTIVDLVTLKNSEHMWGLGIRGGFDTGWHITKNWMFYGDLAFTNMWGKFKKSELGINEESLKGPNMEPVLAGTFRTVDTSEHYSTVIPIIEASIGLSYIDWFSDDSCRFELRAGWEEQIWLDYNRSQDYYRVGNLTLQGLTIKAMLTF